MEMRAQYKPLLLEDIMHLMSTSPPFPEIRLVGLWRAYQHCFKNHEIINFNSRLMNEEASSVHFAFVGVHHALREDIATLTSLEILRWKFREHIDIFLKKDNTSTHNGLDMNGEESVLQSTFVRVRHAYKGCIATLVSLKF